jgi:hypothetical protein
MEQTMRVPDDPKTRMQLLAIMFLYGTEEQQHEVVRFLWGDVQLPLF